MEVEPAAEAVGVGLSRYLPRDYRVFRQ